MKFYIYKNRDSEGKKITKKEALTLISNRQLNEAIQYHEADPYEEQSYMTAKGMLVIDF